MTADEMLAWPLWDLDAIDCERHHLEERRAQLRDRMDVALDAIRVNGYAPEVRREAMIEVRAVWRALDHLRELARELRGREARH